eukprot:m.217436 g.217436  ORF g.217436 m.217436 type:complete len:286 (-) comp15601_c0_seq5:398-1255(-)
MAIRVTVHAATGFSPHHLMFGREMRPLADYSALAIWEEAADQKKTRAFFAGIAECFEEAQRTRLAAHGAATKAQDRQVKQQDRSHPLATHRLAPGTWVMLRDERPAHKLAHRFIGPFRVSARAGQPSTGDSNAVSDSREHHSANYHLCDEDGRPLQRTFPRDKLFAVPSRDIALSMRQERLYSAEEWSSARASCSQVHAGPLPIPDSDGVQRYVVEAILDRQEKGRDRAPFVLVKWAGYHEPQWIPESDVDPEALRPLLRAWRRQLALDEGLATQSRVNRVSSRR